MVFIVLLGLWALVLAPTAYRWFRERSTRGSWESLGEQVVASSANLGAHLAVVDGGFEAGRPFGEAPIGEHRVPGTSTATRAELRQRRRSVLLGMVAGLVASSVLSLIPALGFLKLLAFLDLLGLLAFVGYAFYVTNAEAFAELLNRSEDLEPYGYAEEQGYEEAGYGYDEVDGYDEQWYEPRRAIGQ